MKYRCNNCGAEFSYLPVFCKKCQIRGTNKSFTAIHKTESTLKDIMDANPKIKAEVIELMFIAAEKHYEDGNIDSKTHKLLSTDELRKKFNGWVASKF